MLCNTPFGDNLRGGFVRARCGSLRIFKFFNFFKYLYQHTYGVCLRHYYWKYLFYDLLNSLVRFVRGWLSYLKGYSWQVSEISVE